MRYLSITTLIIFLILNLNLLILIVYSLRRTPLSPGSGHGNSLRLQIQRENTLLDLEDLIVYRSPGKDHGSILCDDKQAILPSLWPCCLKTLRLAEKFLALQ